MQCYPRVTSGLKTLATVDGSKRILTNEDFATMNLDDFRGTELERLLAETLRLPHMR